MVKRKDLRHLTVCSVDPPGCTDIDDALHCRELENGNLEVQILGTHTVGISTKFLAVGITLIILGVPFAVGWSSHR